MKTVLSQKAMWRLGSGAALIAGILLMLVPIQHQQHLEDWARELGETGRPATAVVARQLTTGGRRNRSSTMYFQYSVDGTTYEEEVGCFRECYEAQTQVPIWINPADPRDFVTNYGILSGHHGRFQGFAGFAGVVMVLLTLIFGWSRWRHARKQRAKAVS